MRTASRRLRRLVGLLLLAVTVCWAFVRRRSRTVRWIEPPASLPAGGVTVGAPAEPGEPGELPEDVLATDAGLTELPESAVDDGSADTVDETRVAELLAESPDAEVVVVDEATYEQAVADAAPAPPAEDAEDAASTDAEQVATGPEAAAPAKGTSEADLEADEPAADEEPAESAASDVEEPAAAEELASEEPAADREPVEADASGIEEPTLSIEPELDEDSAGEIPMPTVDETPTREIPAVTDDLRAIRGIGPTMEGRLHSLGIVSYRQLSLLDGAELERAGLIDFRSRIEREDWAGQARELHREKYGRDPF